jgi:enamine deaminase RidA (YjgF/YER057c/UK114 family)
MNKLLASLAFVLMFTPLALRAHPAAEIKRVKGDPQSPILSAAVVPSGTTLYYLSGQVPAVTDPSKPAGSIEQYGDTKTQAISVFGKIEKLLAEQQLTLGDIVKLTVYLVGDPKNGGKLDFKGFSEAYAQFFGTPTQPNIVTRTTLQVVALANPAFLVEIEATAAKSSAPEKPAKPAAPRSAAPTPAAKP